MSNNKLHITDGAMGRMMSWLDKHDVAVISARRNRFVNECCHTLDDRPEEYMCKCAINPDIAPYVYTKKQNDQRTKDMLSYLLTKDYGICPVDYQYAGGICDCAEPCDDQRLVYVVVNVNDDDDFFTDMERLGRYYNQDAIMCKPCGADQCTLLGTNNCEMPGYGLTIHIDNVDALSGILKGLVGTLYNRGGRDYIYDDEDICYTKKKETKNSKCMPQKMKNAIKESVALSKLFDIESKVVKYKLTDKQINESLLYRKSMYKSNERVDMRLKAQRIYRNMSKMY